MERKASCHLRGMFLNQTRMMITDVRRETVTSFTLVIDQSLLGTGSLTKTTFRLIFDVLLVCSSVNLLSLFLSSSLMTQSVCSHLSGFQEGASCPTLHRGASSKLSRTGSCKQTLRSELLGGNSPKLGAVDPATVWFGSL
jgi:hypothetical protein